MKTSIKAVAVIALFTILLSGCTLTITPEEVTYNAPPQSQPNVVTPTPTSPQVVPNYPLNEVLEYDCDGGRLFVNYTSNESARIYDAGAWHSLTRTVNMDGHFVYSDPNYSWHARGNTGYLTLNGAIHARDCSI